MQSRYCRRRSLSNSGNAKNHSEPAGDIAPPATLHPEPLNPKPPAGVSVGVKVSVGVSVRLGVSLGVAVKLGVRVTVGVAVGGKVPVTVNVGREVNVGVAGVPVNVAVGVAVGVSVSDGVAVTVIVGVGVIVGVSVGPGQLQDAAQAALIAISTHPWSQPLFLQKPLSGKNPTTQSSQGLFAHPGELCCTQQSRFGVAVGDGGGLVGVAVLVGVAGGLLLSSTVIVPALFADNTSSRPSPSTSPRASALVPEPTA